MLNASAEIAGAGVDMSELLAGTRLFTIADGGGGDDLGDSDVIMRIGVPHTGNIPGLIGTVTDDGVASAVLSFALPTQAGIIIPTLLRALKS